MFTWMYFWSPKLHPGKHQLSFERGFFHGHWWPAKCLLALINSFRQKHFLWLQFIWMCHWFSALWPKGETGNFSNCTFGSLKICKCAPIWSKISTSNTFSKHESSTAKSCISKWRCLSALVNIQYSYWPLAIHKPGLNVTGDPKSPAFSWNHRG